MTEKRESYTIGGVYGATILTAIVCLALWLITRNFIVVGASVLVVPFFTSKLFNRNVYTRAKVVFFVILAVLFGLCAWLFHAPAQQAPVNDNPPVVSEQEDDKDEDDGEDIEVEDQQVSTQGGGRYSGNGIPGSAKPAPSEKIPTDYSNVGGDPNGGNVNKGNSQTTAGNTNKIEVPDDNSSSELDKKKKEDINKGKTETPLEDGITAVTDNREETKPEVPKKEEPITDKPYSNIDVTEPTVPVAPSKEPEKIPEPLPPTEQIKEDAKEADDNTLDKMLEATGGMSTFNNAKEEEKTPEPEATQTTPEVIKPEAPVNEVDNSQSEVKDTPIVSEDDSEKSEPQPDVNTTETNTSTETKPVEAPVENVTPTETPKPVEETVTPISIQSLDNGKAYAGDSVQFKIKGNVKSVAGLDGYVEGKDYTVTNNCITINTHENEATTITVTVVDVNGTTDTASCEVSAI